MFEFVDELTETVLRLSQIAFLSSSILGTFSILPKLVIEYSFKSCFDSLCDKSLQLYGCSSSALTAFVLRSRLKMFLDELFFAPKFKTTEIRSGFLSSSFSLANLEPRYYSFDGRLLSATLLF